MGAIWAETNTEDLVDKAEKVLSDNLISTFIYVTSFNDNPDTTHRQIMNLFKRAIKAEEERNDST